jgi:signal transduction histidine kinase
MCVAVLSLAWGFAFYAAIRLSEDRVLTNQLRRAAESYPSLRLNLRGYDAVDSLPESLREWARTNPEEGLYEFDTEELHVAVVPADDERRHAFVVFDVSGIEAASSEDWWLLLLITGVVGTLGALGFGLGVLVMRRAVAPVAQLAKLDADIDPEKLSDEDHKRIESSRFGDDEVGVLARTIERTLERISAFVERERYFTGSASHELRTPITVITGALELLEQSDLSATDV